MECPTRLSSPPEIEPTQFEGYWRFDSATAHSYGNGLSFRKNHFYWMNGKIHTVVREMVTCAIEKTVLVREWTVDRTRGKVNLFKQIRLFLKNWMQYFPC